jgi:hypothetical protein
MKRIYIPLFAVYVFLGATALVAEEAVQPTVEATVAKPDAAKKGEAVPEAKPGDDDIEELGWPREYQHEDGEVILYQPQLDEWDDHTTLTAKSAVSVQFKGSDEFHYGALYLKATTEVDKEEEEVLLDKFEITKMHFPDIDDKIAAKTEELVTKAIATGGSMVMSLARLVAELEADSENVREVELNLDPPPIFYSDKPAILLGFMGEPSFKPVEGVDGLMFAVNTNWSLLLDVATSTYYLLNEESWMEAADPLKGPWKNTQKLPELFSKLPDDENWKAVKQHIPGKAAEKQPKIFVATRPSELIVTDGEPAFGPISGTKLMYVTNTDSDLFIDNDDKKFYYLTAGRWFRAEKLEGPWKAASADLPEAFAKIPEDHIKNDVLNAVPGTMDAEAAVLLANVPQKATVSRKDTTTEVVYEGEPEFVEIKGTSPTVSYALNSPNDVFLVSGLYYALVDGVWFVGSTPTGPWAVATEVDEAIYSIPEDSPKYNATYVRVYDYTDDDVIVGYTSGYYGSYVATTGVLMFGLGLWAGSYWGDYGYYGYPSYYGYGSGMRYGYGYGYYRGGGGYYGPYGGISGRAGYNPGTGRYYRGGVARGPYGSAFARTFYNPRTNRRTSRAGARTPYGSWGKSVTSNGSNWAKAGHRSRGRKTIAGAKGSGGRAVLGGYNRRTGEGFKVAKGKNNNLFVGKDGGVYKRNGKNDWSKHSGKDGWKKSNVGKLDAKDRRSVRSREGGVGELRGAGALAGAGGGALAGAGAGALAGAGAGALAGSRDRKGGKAGVKNRKAGAANKSVKQQQRSKTARSKSASNTKSAARKQTRRSTDNAKLAARITSPQKYYSSGSRPRGSSASTRSNLNRSYSTRSSGNRRANYSSRNRSSARSRSSGRSMGGGGRSMRGGGGRGGGGRGGGGRR